jgi:hypothetical protein
MDKVPVRQEVARDQVITHIRRLTRYAGNKRYAELARKGVELQRLSKTLSPLFLEQIADSFERNIIYRDRPSIQKTPEGPCRVRR